MGVMTECCKVIWFYFDVCNRNNLRNVGGAVSGFVDWGKVGQIVDDCIEEDIVSGEGCVTVDVPCYEANIFLMM